MPKMQRDAAYIAGLEAAKEASQGCVHAIQCVLEIQKLIDAKKGELVRVYRAPMTHYVSTRVKWTCNITWIFSCAVKDCLSTFSKSYDHSPGNEIIQLDKAPGWRDIDGLLYCPNHELVVSHRGVEVYG